jgi:hypothetical protein
MHSKHATAAGGDRLVKHQPALLIRDSAAPFHEFDHLIRGREVQLPG